MVFLKYHYFPGIGTENVPVTQIVPAMIGNSIEKKWNWDIANIVEKPIILWEKLKNDLKKPIQIFQKKGKKRDLLGMWVSFFCQNLGITAYYTLQNYSNFKSNFSFNNRSLESHDHFRTRGNASYNNCLN